jgi:RES domain-containing protein
VENEVLILYRISNHSDLTGKGGELAEGRWHTRRTGKRIVYLSDHPALCLLEMLVHTERETDLPDNFQLLSLKVPDRRILTLDQSALPRDWPNNRRATQTIGDEWLQARRSVALLVPSALIPNAYNALLNPLVVQAGVLRAELLGRFPIDPRLWQGR